MNKLLNILLALSIIFILIFDILFADSPEWFKHAGKIVDITSNLCLAYIASYIFYIVVVVKKEINDKKKCL